MGMSRRERTLEEARLRRQMAGKPPFSSGLSLEPPVMASGLPDVGVGNQPLAKDGSTGLWIPTDVELLLTGEEGSPHEPNNHHEHAAQCFY
jgi:hypothetical protein